VAGEDGACSVNGSTDKRLTVIESADVPEDGPEVCLACERGILEVSTTAPLMFPTVHRYLESLGQSEIDTRYMPRCRACGRLPWEVYDPGRRMTYYRDIWQECHERGEYGPPDPPGILVNAWWIGEALGVPHDVLVERMEAALESGLHPEETAWAKAAHDAWQQGGGHAKTG